MKRCPICQSRYRDSAAHCPFDGSALVALADPLIGRLIGSRYLIEARLGAGGMGTVYRGRHQALDRQVALKILHPTLASDQLEAAPSARVGLQDRGLPSVVREWAKAQRAVLDREARREALERERDDLGFQISQLKGRLGASAAVSSAEHSEAADGDGAIGADLRAKIYALRLDADRVMEHLAQVAGGRAHG